MPRAAKLKVYRTPIGFHDAYVAAPSQKAALEAWGSDANLFARGIAELVTDAALTKEPLARPGEVIRRLHGTAAEQIAALPPDPQPSEARSQAAKASGSADAKPAPKPQPAAKAKPKQKREPKRKPKPRPSRDALEQAEAAVAAAERRHEQEKAALAREEEELARRRKALAKAQADELRRLEAKRERAGQAYRAALERWRG